MINQILGKKVLGDLTIKDVLQAFLIALILSLGLLQIFRVCTTDGESMENTLSDGDKLFLFILVKNFDYEDIIVANVENHKIEDVDFIIKRIVGLPGDTIEIKNSKLYRNGNRVDEPYIKEKMKGSMEKIILGKDEYFVCGDNRNFSMDSRSELIGTVKKEEIFGKVLCNVSKLKIY